MINKAAEDRFRIARGTHSAAAAAEKTGGLVAVLARFPLSLQRAMKEHCMDYININVKLQTLENKFRGQKAPTVLVATRDNMREVRRRLREISGDAYPELVAYLESEEARTGFAITEDDAVDETEARITRRKLAKSIRFTGNRPIAQSVHNQVSAKGVKSSWNEAEVDNRSYYERIQETYGKGRRGSTEHAGGAWDEIFAEAEGGEEGGGDAGAAATGARRSGARTPPAPPTVPVRGGTEAGAGTYRMPAEAYVSPEAAAAAPAAATASTSRSLKRPPSIRSIGSASGDSPASGRTPRKRPTELPGAAMRRRSFVGLSELGLEDIGSASQAPSVFTRSSDMVKQTDTARAFTVLRGTHSAAKASELAGGVSAVMARYPLSLQRAIREACLDILELEVRVHTLEDRWERDRKPDDPEPAILGVTRNEYDQAMSKLFELAEEADARELLSVMRNSEVAEAVIETEDDATTEEEARILRRRLNKFFPKGFNHGHTVTVHDATDSRGSSSVWNTKEEDNRTYYERQRDKYGRARRGSPGLAGASAWDEVFAEAEGGGKGADPHAVAAVGASAAHAMAAGEPGAQDPRLEYAMQRARSGDPTALAALASDLAASARRTGVAVPSARHPDDGMGPPAVPPPATR